MSENLKLGDNGKSDEIKISLGSDVCWEVPTGEKKRVHKNLFAVSSIFDCSLDGSFGETSIVHTCLPLVLLVVWQMFQ